MLDDRHYNKDKSETGLARARAHVSGESRTTHFAIAQSILVYLFTIPYCVCMPDHLSIIIVPIDYANNVR